MKKILSFLCFLFFTTSLFLTYTVYNYKQKNTHRFEVKIPINETIFKEKLTKNPPEWVLNQIERDLNNYKKEGISNKSLDTVFYARERETLNLIRFKIVDKHLSFSLSKKNLDHKQFRHLLAAITKLNELVDLPDVDFIVSLEDGFDQGYNAPIFVYSKSNASSSLILIPDFKAFTGYPTLRKKMAEGSLKWPWAKKKNKAFWRGSTTGSYLTSSTWDQIARVKLALLAHLHPDKIDARLTSVVQCDPEIPSLMKKQRLLGKKWAPKKHLKYKYLIDVDGNSCSFERYFWLLLSNCVVLKQMTPNMQWYYGALKPYEHFIPLKEDLSDLIEKINWAQMHDNEAEQIAKNATAFIKNELSIEDTFIYMAHLLQAYAYCLNK